MKPLENIEDLENRIYTVRGLHVMVDTDLAELYKVETKVLNQAVKRNIERFPTIFRFQLTENEWKNLRSQNATLEDISLRSHNVTLNNSRGKHRKYLPWVFTEQGVAMLSAVLKSETAVHVSIQIMQAFVQMRKFMVNYSGLFKRLDKVERKQLEADTKFERIFNAMQTKQLAPKQGIFFEGQVFDAYIFISDLLRTANKEIILIDNYIDDTVLTLLDKRKKDVAVCIYTKNIDKKMKLDIEKHNLQYSPIDIKTFSKSHDRFLIIDHKSVYHIGASLKDLGKKWFAFSKIALDPKDLITRLEKQ